MAGRLLETLPAGVAYLVVPSSLCASLPYAIRSISKRASSLFGLFKSCFTAPPGKP